MRCPSPFVPSLLVVLSLVGLGCRKEEVRAYQAPREVEAPAVPPPSGGGAVLGASGNPGEGRATTAPWTVPEGWTEQPSSGMRVASYGVKAPDGRSADVSVVALQGGAGGELSNVNRWRNQIGLDALTENQLEAARTPVKVGGRVVPLFDLEGDKPTIEGKYRARTLAAILPAGEMTVFFKITGEEALVAAEKPKFISWLQSVETGDGGDSAEPEAPSTSRPASPPTPAPMAEAPAAGRPGWTVPAGWKDGGTRPMRLASFEIPDASGPGDVSVTALSGEAGGLLANVNRWRGQVGLPPWTEEALKKESVAVQSAGGDAGVLVDLPGAEKRILGAIFSHGGQSWFFKMTASAALAGREKGAFEGFVRSVRF